jgi:hypothetical protein
MRNFNGFFPANKYPKSEKAKMIRHFEVLPENE